MSLEIHTSDRANFKRCRRRWNMTSPIRQNLTPISQSKIELWFGTGVHFALEDFHGYNRFGDPRKALEAYANAHIKGKLALPENAEEYVSDTGYNMLTHYLDWLETRDEFKTVWIDGKPQVEVRRLITIPGLDDVDYSVTFDRVMTDPYGRWWICDYKTAAQMDTNKLPTDPQITSYLLFAPSVYPDAEFEGMVYLQLRKAYPKTPLALKTGGLSMNKSQLTTRGVYLRELKKMYGNNIPSKYVPFLDMLSKEESPEGDKFIRRDFVRRNRYALEAEYEKIIQEVTEMRLPTLPLYPNPTRDCMWDCAVRSVCLAMDDGSDWEAILKDNYNPRPEDPNWRKFLEYPTN